MGMNIDEALARLGSDTPHGGLSGLEDRVLDAIASQPVAGIGAGTTLSAVGLALVFGVFSNAVPSANAEAAPALSPPGGSSPLVPPPVSTGSR